MKFSIEQEKGVRQGVYSLSKEDMREILIEALLADTSSIEKAMGAHFDLVRAVANKAKQRLGELASRIENSIREGA